MDRLSAETMLEIAYRNIYFIIEREGLCKPYVPYSPSNQINCFLSKFAKRGLSQLALISELPIGLLNFQCCFLAPLHKS